MSYTKFLTFSYDDGVTQDRRLIELFDRYGLKATFHMNSQLLGNSGSLIRNGVSVTHNKVEPGEIKELYRNHEVAGHTLTHPNLSELSDEAEIIRQIEQDRENLSALCGYNVTGFSYPGGGVNFNEKVRALAEKNTGIEFARTTIATGNFDVQKDLFAFNPTEHHTCGYEKLNALFKAFCCAPDDKPQIFYLWGHSYEFDIDDSWADFEDFLKLVSGHSDIFYGTNTEVFRQVSENFSANR